MKLQRIVSSVYFSDCSLTVEKIFFFEKLSTTTVIAWFLRQLNSSCIFLKNSNSTDPKLHCISICTC